MTPRDGLRPAASAYVAGAGDIAIREAMAVDSALIEPPLVETERGEVPARPPERVRAIP